MKVYKYRKYDALHLDAIESNYFWASTRETLNDPFETLFLSDSLLKQFRILSLLLPRNDTSVVETERVLKEIHTLTDNIGIFSLSANNLSELLWAHYGDSHKGFCTEYDLDILAYNNLYHKLHVFPVQYSNNPPELSMDFVGKDPIPLYQKIAGTKSLPWEYEQEIRVITDKSGQHSYEYIAVTGIYFGSRMNNSHKDYIMQRLKGRGIKYYQIELASKTYNLTAKPVDDHYIKSPSYLFQVVQPTDIQYEFKDKSYNKYLKKGSVRVMLSKKVSYHVLEFLSRDIKDKVFRQAERLSIFYYVDSMYTSEVAWAITHFENVQFKTEIIGLNAEDELKLKQFIDESSRDIIGAWIDNAGYAVPAIVLYRENHKYFINQIYADTSINTKEQDFTVISDGIKLTNKVLDRHNNYITIDGSGHFKYHNTERVFRELKPYKFNGL